MFDNMKTMAALAGLMKNKDKIKAAGERIKAKAEDTRVTADAGGGAARATVNGAMKVLSVELSPALVMGMAADDKTRTLAASLIADAVNEALKQAQHRMKGHIDEEAKALGFEGGLPGIPGLTQ
jgi:DNA-binding protein YbaB